MLRPGLPEVLHQVAGPDEAGPAAPFDGPLGQGRGQVGPAHAGRPEEWNAGGLGHEGQAGCLPAAVSGLAGPADTADTGGYRELSRKWVSPAFSGSGFEFPAFLFDTWEENPEFFGKTSPDFDRRTGNFSGPSEVCAANFN